MCEATTAAVVCDTLGLIDRYHCRDRTIMVFTKADGMALASQWHKLFSKLLGSEPGGRLSSVRTFKHVSPFCHWAKNALIYVWCMLLHGSYQCITLLSMTSEISVVRRTCVVHDKNNAASHLMP